MRDRLQAFYELVGALKAAGEQGRPAKTYTSMSALPDSGVHFLFEPGETRAGSSEARIVYVGAHGTTAKTTLWSRLKHHMGTESGNGNHHGSVLRKHVGAALIARDGVHVPTWGKGKDNSGADRAAEMSYELKTSAHVREMTLIWVETPSGPAGKALRDFVADGAVALLSNGRAPFDPPSAGWLGRHSPTDAIQESGLWNVQGTDDRCDPEFISEFETAVIATIARSGR